MISDRTLRRLELLMPRVREYNEYPEKMPRVLREEFSMMVASTFPEFAEFAEVGMRVLGFSISEMQLDIARYMQHGPRKSMVQAQRGEAKSTLAALFAVWSLVHDQNYRILIVSGGEKQASDVAVMIIRLIEQWPLLCWMRPDKSRGDRTSFENYDVHCDLRRIDKTASVSCVGITANLQGRRADLLIPDDIETAKNSFNQSMREQLLLLSKDFAAINTHGKTLYLGTPQSKDSIYKTLPARGFEVRIWPGRYPNAEELQRYAIGTLAPMILEAIETDPSLMGGAGLDGTRGKPADLVRYDEDALIEKELDFGNEGFSLQFMLDTSLADAARTKIKLADLIVAAFDAERAPEIVQYECSERVRIKDLPWTLQGVMVYAPGFLSEKYAMYTHKVMILDPAGSGGDEVAFACGGALNSYIHVFTVGGLRGGMTEENIQTLFDIADEFGITDIKVEANMGAGVVVKLLEAHAEKHQRLHLGFEDFYAKGQKERRIIDTISPLTRRHKLIVHQRAIEDDLKYCELHPRENRAVMSAWYQLGSITYDRGSLVHDDRADCIQGVCMFLKDLIAVDDERAQQRREEEHAAEFVNNPMGYALPPQRARGVLSRINRR